VAGGYLGDRDYATSGSGANVSRWSFTVDPGYYEIHTTYLEGTNRADNAPYVVQAGTTYGGVTAVGAAILDQTTAPDDLTAWGANWESLGEYGVDGNALVVEVSNAANGVVIADAIRIEKVTPLLAAEPPLSPADTAPLAAADLLTVASAAIGHWQAAGLTSGQLAVLESAEYRIADLSGIRLGQAGSNSITIDADAAGYGWFIDVTPAMAEEFDAIECGVLVARREGAADGRMDLLTAVLHEMGHLLGRTHATDTDRDGELMAAHLSAGQRYLPSDYLATVDAVLACDDVL
jgi:hypothetical protein